MVFHKKSFSRKRICSIPILLLVTFSDVYLEPCQTSAIDLFCENDQQLKVYFRKKSFIVDV